MTTFFSTNADGNLDNVYLHNDEEYLITDTLTTGGKLWLSGYNQYGRLGDNGTTNQKSPVQTIAGGSNWKQVQGSDNHTAAIKTDGTLWTWGYNSNGQLGDNTRTNRSSPVQTVSGGSTWKQVSANNLHTAAIKTDGTLWTWGYNSNGQLGDNTNANRSSPIQTVAGGSDWKQVACGAYQTGAIKTDGTLWLWGWNGLGALGDNTYTHRSSPVQTVSGGTDWKQVALGDDGAAAIKTDGTLWMWGNNNHGQLGNNNFSITSVVSPIQTVAGGTTWKQVSYSSTFVAAIKTDGTLWLWGYNNHGQLGNNSSTDKSSPVQTVSGGTNWKQVSTGSSMASAIKTDGRLWSWGFNYNGELGIDVYLDDRSSPIQVVSGGITWRTIGNGIGLAATTF